LKILKLKYSIQQCRAIPLILSILATYTYLEILSISNSEISLVFIRYFEFLESTTFGVQLSSLFNVCSNDRNMLRVLFSYSTMEKLSPGRRPNQQQPVPVWKKLARTSYSWNRVDRPSDICRSDVYL